MNPWQGVTNLFQRTGQPSAQPTAPTGPWGEYWNANPDLATAYAQNSYGLNPEQFAQTHYQNYGAAEGRTGPVVGASQGMPGQTYFAGGGPVAGDRDQAGNYVGNNPASLGGGVTDYSGMRPQPFAGGTYSGWQNTVAQQRGQLPPTGSGTLPNAGSGAGSPQVMPGINPNSATKQNPFLSTALDAFNNTQKPFDTSWLDNLSNTLYSQANQNFQDNLNPALNSASIAAGGYGGDRAALAKGVVMDRMNQNVMNAMAPQYAGAYENSLNRALAGGSAAAGVGTGLEGLDLQRLLGMGGLGVQAYNADTSRQLGIGGLQNQQFGLDTQRQLGLGDLAAKNLLTEAQVAQMANQTANPQYTNPWGAALGGGLLGWQLLDSILKGQG